MKAHEDARGCLTVLDPLPFQPVRMFTVSSDRPYQFRGAHALKTCHLLMMVTHGAIRVSLRAEREDIYYLRYNSTALHIPPMTWVNYCFVGDAGGSIMVLASEHFDPSAYIDDYTEFLGALVG